jgi:murein DD-endopeptidase MepM/ murein hydrolase activator NlpD
MLKKNAIYRVTIYSNTETIIVTMPITCSISTTRGLVTDSNSATIKLYNLAPNTRKKIFQDSFTLDSSKWHYVHVEAGYGNNLNGVSTIFRGRVMQAYSYRDGGSVDTVTEIQAQALDIFDCQVSTTILAGTTKIEAVQQLVNAGMPNCKLANVGKLDGKILSDTSFDGNTIDAINEITGGKCFVDNENVNVLMNNEVLDVPVPVITDSNCLLSTPIRRDANLEVKMIFQPDLIVGQLLEIQSSVSPNFNGQYKVLGFTHDLFFSGAVCGERITTVQLWILPLLPGAIDQLTGNQQSATTGAYKVNGYDVSPVEMTSTGVWVKPVAYGSISSGFGRRSRPTDGASTNHKGIDYAVPIGTSVRATRAGTVKILSQGSIGYGHYIIIEHGTINGQKMQSLYAHLSRAIARNGAKVQAGDIIGLSGASGNVTGPHLHFEIRRNGVAVNPLNYVSR